MNFTLVGWWLPTERYPPLAMLFSGCWDIGGEGRVRSAAAAFYSGVAAFSATLWPNRCRNEQTDDGASGN